MEAVSARISKLIEDTGLSNKDFAEKIQVNPAIISHILSGRNKPSLTVIQAILQEFTNVNSDYLLSGTGSLWKKEVGASSAPARGAAELPGLESEGVRRVPPPGSTPLPRSTGVEETGSDGREATAKETVQSEDRPIYEQAKPTRAKPESKTRAPLVKIVFFYEDHTFEEYRPS